MKFLTQGRILFVLSILSLSSCREFKWGGTYDVLSSKSDKSTNVNAIVRDAQLDYYIFGETSDSIDIDFSEGMALLDGEEKRKSFIQKVDKEGGHLWVVELSSDHPDMFSMVNSEENLGFLFVAAVFKDTLNIVGKQNSIQLVNDELGINVLKISEGGVINEHYEIIGENQETKLNLKSIDQNSKGETILTVDLQGDVLIKGGEPVHSDELCTVLFKYDSLGALTWVKKMPTDHFKDANFSKDGMICLSGNFKGVMAINIQGTNEVVRFESTKLNDEFTYDGIMMSLDSESGEALEAFQLKSAGFVQIERCEKGPSNHWLIQGASSNDVNEWFGIKQSPFITTFLCEVDEADSLLWGLKILNKNNLYVSNESTSHTEKVSTYAFSARGEFEILFRGDRTLKKSEGAESIYVCVVDNGSLKVNEVSSNEKIDFYAIHRSENGDEILSGNVIGSADINPDSKEYIVTSTMQTGVVFFRLNSNQSIFKKN